MIDLLVLPSSESAALHIFFQTRNLNKEASCIEPSTSVKRVPCRVVKMEQF
jgi:hypothetical protein